MGEVAINADAGHKRFPIRLGLLVCCGLYPERAQLPAGVAMVELCGAYTRSR